MLIHIIPILVIVSATLHIRSDLRQKRLQTYVYKPLTIMLIILFCFLQKPEVSTFYRNMIVAGLVFSLLGDTFLMAAADRFLHGLASFFVAHVLYLIAFISDSVFPPDVVYIIPGLIAGVIVLWVLLPKVGRKTIPVVLYTIVLILLFWQSLGRMGLVNTHSSIVAFAGTLLFILSDVTLVLYRFVGNRKKPQVFILSSYYLAQLLISFSV